MNFKSVSQGRIIPKEDCENNALVRIEAKYCEYEESLNISRFYVKYIRHVENVSNGVETKSRSSLYEKKKPRNSMILPVKTSQIVYFQPELLEGEVHFTLPESEEVASCIQDQ